MNELSRNGNLVVYELSGKRYLQLGLVVGVLGTDLATLMSLIDDSIVSKLTRYETTNYVSESLLPLLLQDVANKFTSLMQVKFIAANWLRILAGYGFDLVLWVNSGSLPGAPITNTTVITPVSNDGRWLAVNGDFTCTDGKRYLVSGTDPALVTLPPPRLGAEVTIIAEFQTFNIVSTPNTIRFGVKTGVNLTSTDVGDAVTLVCSRPDFWMVFASIGNFNLT